MTVLFEGKSRCNPKAKIVKCEENGNEYCVNNKKEYAIYKYHIDGDIEQSGGAELRCDYIVEAETPERPTAFVVELKGSDIDRAVKQIEHTIQRYGLLNTHDVRRRIIVHSSRTHQVYNKGRRDQGKKYPDYLIRTHTHTDYL